MSLYYSVVGSIGARYTLPAIDYRQFLFYCATQLVEVADTVGAVLKKAEAESLKDWFAEKTVEEVNKDGYKLV